MRRLSVPEGTRAEAIAAERQQHCLNCGWPVADRPRGCKSGHCKNCGHPYPLGDCSD